MSLNKSSVRICSNQRSSIPLPSNFVSTIVSISSSSWLDKTYLPDADTIFSHDIIFIPYRWNGIRSCFVVIGQRYIKDYVHSSFDKHRPCILHLCPTIHSSRRQASIYKSVCGRIRSWLNVAWRNLNGVRDVTCNPFHHRSMPWVHPNGKDS